MIKPIRILLTVLVVTCLFGCSGNDTVTIDENNKTELIEENEVIIQEETEQIKYYEALKDVDIKTKPSLQGHRISYLEKGDYFIILEEKENEGAKWYRLATDVWVMDDGESFKESDKCNDVITNKYYLEWPNLKEDISINHNPNNNMIFETEYVYSNNGISYRKVNGEDWGYVPPIDIGVYCFLFFGDRIINERDDNNKIVAQNIYFEGSGYDPNVLCYNDNGQLSKILQSYSSYPNPVKSKNELNNVDTFTQYIYDDFDRIVYILNCPRLSRNALDEEVYTVDGRKCEYNGNLEFVYICYAEYKDAIDFDESLDMSTYISDLNITLMDRTYKYDDTGRLVRSISITPQSLNAVDINFDGDWDEVVDDYIY